jgi:hypothetical protein
MKGVDMNRLILPLTVCAILLSLAHLASAQTTRPASMDLSTARNWEQTLQEFAVAAHETNISLMRQLLADDAAVRSFGGDTDQNLLKLIGHISDAQIIGLHAYNTLPATIASDLSQDFTDCPLIPRDAKSFLIPRDDVHLRRANQTAMQWVSNILEVDERSHIGIIAFWQSQERIVGSRSHSARLFIILIKGQQTAPGVFRIRQINYGNPLNS